MIRQGFTHHKDVPVDIPVTNLDYKGLSHLDFVSVCLICVVFLDNLYSFRISFLPKE